MAAKALLMIPEDSIGFYNLFYDCLICLICVGFSQSMLPSGSSLKHNCDRRSKVGIKAQRGRAMPCHAAPPRWPLVSRRWMRLNHQIPSTTKIHKGEWGINLIYLVVSLVRGMTDAFYGLIASLGFPWFVFSLVFFPCFPLGNQRKSKDAKGKTRSSKKNWF